MTNELVKTEGTALVESQHYARLMGNEAVDTRDLVLPKVLLMQGLSKLVADEKALMGEMRDSLEGKLLAGKDKPLEFIPFHMTKTWVLFEEGPTGKMEYKQQVPWNAENQNWKWEDIENGKKVRRDQSLNFYCLLPEEIAGGMFIPYMLSFRRTSYLAGRKLVTAKEKFKLFKKPLCAFTFNLVSRKTENDLGTFYVFDVEQGRATTAAELEAVAPWFDMVQTQNIKVDDSDLVQEAEGHAAPASATASASGMVF